MIAFLFGSPPTYQYEPGGAAWTSEVMVVVDKRLAGSICAMYASFWYPPGTLDI